MGFGATCAAPNCYNSRKKTPNKSFFRFPLDPQRSLQWILSCRRKDLMYRDPQYLYNNCYICMDHFEPHCFLNDLRNRLQPLAIPTLFDIPSLSESDQPKHRAKKPHYPERPNPCSSSKRCKKKEPIPVFRADAQNVFQIGASNKTVFRGRRVGKKNSMLHASIKKEDIESKNPSSDHKPYHPLVVLSMEADKTDPVLSSSFQRKKVRGLRTSLNKVQKQKSCHASHVRKTSLTITEIVEQARKYLPETALMFFSSQMQLFQQKQKGLRYSSESKQLFLGIYYQSPETYHFLSSTFAFPSISTLAKWIKVHSHTKSELSNQIMELLKMKVSRMNPIEKLCCICVAEIAIKPSLTYEKRSDQIIGFEDFGTIRSPKIANSALVLMAQGICEKWKQPLYYALTSGPCKSERIQTLLFSVLEKLSSMGLQVTSIICHQGPNFHKMLRKLGVCEEQPFFQFLDQHYYVVYDPSHLLKGFARNLYKFNLAFDDCQAAWSDIEQVYALESKCNFQYAWKLTENHVKLPSFSKLKVSLVEEVLGHRVAAKIEAYAHAGQIPLKALGTAVTCQKIDEILHCVKCDIYHEAKVCKKWISSSPHLKTMQEFLNWINKCRFLDRNSGKDCTSSIKCLRRWKISIKAILMLLKDLHSWHGIKVLQMRRLNQDDLEDFFGQIRVNSGCKVKPTSFQFTRAFKQLSLSCLMQAPTTNCTTDDDNVILSKILEACLNASRDSSPMLVTQNVYDGLSVGKLELRNPETNAFQCVCEHVLQKCQDMHFCDLCEKCSYLKEVAEVNSEYENEKLISPNPKFISQLMALENRVVNFLERNAHHTNIGSSLLKSMHSVDCSVLPSCFPKEFLIKYYSYMRMHYMLKLFNKSLNTKDMKQQNFVVVTEAKLF